MAELIVNTGALLQNYRRYAEAGQVIPCLLYTSDAADE